MKLKLFSRNKEESERLIKDINQKSYNTIKPKQDSGRCEHCIKYYKYINDIESRNPSK